jgi:hypothetical protein
MNLTILILPSLNLIHAVTVDASYVLQLSNLVSVMLSVVTNFVKFITAFTELLVAAV